MSELRVTVGMMSEWRFAEEGSWSDHDYPNSGHVYNHLEYATEKRTHFLVNVPTPEVAEELRASLDNCLDILRDQSATDKCAAALHRIGSKVYDSLLTLQKRLEADAKHGLPSGVAAVHAIRAEHPEHGRLEVDVAPGGFTAAMKTLNETITQLGWSAGHTITYLPVSSPAPTPGTDNYPKNLKQLNGWLLDAYEAGQLTAHIKATRDPHGYYYWLTFYDDLMPDADSVHVFSCKHLRWGAWLDEARAAIKSDASTEADADAARLERYGKESS